MLYEEIREQELRVERAQDAWNNAKRRGYIGLINLAFDRLDEEERRLDALYRAQERAEEGF